MSVELGKAEALMAQTGALIYQPLLRDLKGGPGLGADTADPTHTRGNGDRERA